MSFDLSTVIVLMLAAALAGALLGVLPEWRRMMGGGLPIHRHMGEEHTAFEAELRCALCSGRERCARRAAPLEGCPNAELFRKAASRKTAAPTA